MAEMLKKEVFLKGLDCPHCAQRIEDEIGALSEVHSAKVDFISQKLFLEAEGERALNTAFEKAKAIVHTIEPSVDLHEVSIKAHTADHGFSSAKILRFIIGASLFSSALIFQFNAIAEFFLFLIAYLLVGAEVLYKAVRNIAGGFIFDENFLMCLATVGAFAIGEFAEGVAVMLFFQIGEFFEGLAVNRSRRSIDELMNLRPDFANLKNGDSIEKVSPDQVHIGDIIIVKPGEKVPLDGVVLEGNSSLDTSSLTGESIPRQAEPGTKAFSGSVNISGMLTIEVQKEYGESTASRILDLVQNASTKKAPTENFITKFSRYYTPAVVVTAIVLAALPPLFIPGEPFSQWLNRALVFLVISCPCALVISIPLGFFGGIGCASRNGILVKGGNYLEALNAVDAVVFDKTGTLTKGVFQVTKVESAQFGNENGLLEYAAYAESFSNHPIAISIQKAYGKAIDKDQVKNVEEIAGLGIRAEVMGKEVLAGNDKLLAKHNVAFSASTDLGTVLYLAIDGLYAGYIVISDEVKSDSAKAIGELKTLGVRTFVMLTGDGRAVALSIGKQLGIDAVYPELLPDQKVEKIEMLQAQKRKGTSVIFVGDGINDAPVLTRADVGIAMGGLGSDASIEAAEIVLMTDEPSKLPLAIRIAKRTRRIVWENIVFALGVKLCVLAMGAFGIATMWEAVFADVGVTLIAVLNSARAMSLK